MWDGLCSSIGTVHGKIISVMKILTQEQIPPWATQVVSRVERRLNGIIYSILLEDTDSYQSCLVWKKEVLFGTSESRHAGCYAFQDASKEQELLAIRYSTVLGNLIEEYRYD